MTSRGFNSLRYRALMSSHMTCGYCWGKGTANRGPDGRAWHLDRWWPGKFGGVYEPGNVVLSCATCNLAKSAHDPRSKPHWDSALSVDTNEYIIGYCPIPAISQGLAQ